jgi:hypothetical protein
LPLTGFYYQSGVLHPQILKTGVSIKFLSGFAPEWEYFIPEIGNLKFSLYDAPFGFIIIAVALTSKAAAEEIPVAEPVLKAKDILVVPATCCTIKLVVEPEVKFKKLEDTSKDKPTEPVCNLNEPVPTNEPVNEPEVTEEEILILVNPDAVVSFVIPCTISVTGLSIPKCVKLVNL